MSGRRMLFHRDFRGYTGGHGKVWDYFNHALALGWDARVYLAEGSLRGHDNPWMAVPERIEPQWRPERADVLFLAGMDWQALPRTLDGRRPVVNLVQGVRHADPALPLHGFLDRPAWRVCVSRPVADAILATGRVTGPVRVIPAALRLPDALAQEAGEGEGIFIGALKNPELGRGLAAALRGRGHRVELHEEWLPREAYLASMARARVAVPLPHASEGFFLPGLEAMALGRPLVMPPCVGSAEYAADGVNCLMPAATAEALAAAVEDLLAQPQLRRRLVGEGHATALRHAPAAERAAFAAVLEEMRA